MRLGLLTPFLGLVALGCYGDPAQQIVGHWSVDSSATDLPKMPFPGFEDRIDTILSSIDLKFHTDGTAQFSSGLTLEGRWHFDGTSVVIDPLDPRQLRRLPLGLHELRFEVEPDLEHMDLRWQTPVGKAKVAFVKSG